MKKLLVLLLSLVMICSNFVAVHADEAKFTDEDMYDLLYRLGMPQYEKEPDDVIVRAEMAGYFSWLTSAVNSYTFREEFSDVTQDTPNYNAIIHLVESGSISKADKFYPDDKATFGQALKVAVTMLGYDVIIDGEKWKEGYLKKAQELEITDGINVGFDSELTFDILCRLIYNILGTQMLEKDYSDKSLEQGQSWLEYRFDLRIIKGIVNANSITALNSSDNVMNNSVTVGNVLLNDDENIALVELGKKVVAYVDEDDNLKAIYADGNEIFTIEASSLIHEMSEYSKTEIFYEDENGNDKRIRISDTADVIYNGVAYPDFTVEDLKPENGSLTLISNNGDNIYDVVMINEYRNIVVKGISAEKMIIFDRFGDGVELESFDNYELTDNSGNAIVLSNIAIGSVVSVYESKNQEVVKLACSAVPVTGLVESISTQEGKRYVTIDGDTFAVANNLEKAIDDGLVEDFGLNQYGVWYLDVSGKLAAKKDEEFEGEWQYGFMIKAIYESSVESLYFTIYTTRGKAEKYTAQDDILFNGKSEKINDVFDKLALQTEDDGAVKRRLVRFRGSLGKLTGIDTIEQGKGGEGDKLEEYANNATGYYSINTKRLGTGDSIGIKVNSGAVFSVPIGGENMYQEEMYSNKFSASNNNEVTYSAYNIDMQGKAEALVFWRDSSQKGESDRSYMLVSNVYSAINSDNEPADAIQGYNTSGVLVSYSIKTHKGITVPKKGDMIYYTTDDLGRIDSVQIILSAEDARTKKLAERVYNISGDTSTAFLANAQWCLTLSTIVDMDGETLTLLKPGEDLSGFATTNSNDCTFYDFSHQFGASVIYLVNQKGVHSISGDELMAYIGGSNVAVLSRYGCMYMAIVFEK